MLWSVEGRKENKMQRASFELPGGAPFLTVKRPSVKRGLLTRRKRAPHMEWEFMCRIGIAGEDVIGKGVGSIQGSRTHPP